MKRIYLGSDTFDYGNLSELQLEAEKHNINIDNFVRIGNYTTLERGSSLGAGCSIGIGCTIKKDCTIEKYCTIGSNTVIYSGTVIGKNTTIGEFVTIWKGVTISNGVTVGYYCKIGDNATISKNLTILDRARIDAGWKITKIFHVMKTYKYNASGYIVDGIIIIQMGCFTRTLKEWESDFWNNEDEFRRGSVAGEQRLVAYNKIKEVMEVELAKITPS